MHVTEHFHFLLVEDELFAQVICKHVIEQAGYSVDIASNSREALALLQNNRYHLIFLDLGLPDIAGTELIKELRNTMHLEIPIIAVSAFDSTSKKNECVEIGFDDFMEKPFDLEKFHDILTGFLVSSHE